MNVKFNPDAQFLALDADTKEDVAFLKKLFKEGIRIHSFGDSCIDDNMARLLIMPNKE